MTRTEIFLTNRLNGLDNERSKLTEKLSKLNKKRTEIVEELQSVCTHSETEVTNRYIPGSYLNTSTHTKETICSICGIQVSFEFESGDYG